MSMVPMTLPNLLVFLKTSSRNMCSVTGVKTLRQIIITKNQMIQLKCAACGFVSDVDMKDKLTTFILKNPPEPKKGSKDKKALRRAEKERMEEGEAADVEQKKLKKDLKKNSSKDGLAKTGSSRKKAGGSDDYHGSPPRGHANERGDDDEDDDGIQWQTDTSLEAAQKRIQEQLNTVTADMVMLSTDDPQKSKGGNKAHGSPKGAPPPPEDHAAVEIGVKGHERVLQEVKAILKKGVPANQLKTSVASVSGSAQEIMSALFEALFDGVERRFSKVVGKKKNYLVAAVDQDEGAQLLLLHAIEQFWVKSNTAAVKEVALVLKDLYDADVLEEEFIVQWYQEGLVGGNKESPVWKNCKPFIEWLRNAESESEEE